MSSEKIMQQALLDILSQATRNKRASGLKRYLETDLEIIARKAGKGLRDASKAKRSQVEPPPYYGMMELVED